MELQYRKLSGSEIEVALAHSPLWEVKSELLCRVFDFHTYLEGALFAIKVAHVAEDLDHHPDILIGYRKVSVSVNTHSVNGISSYDFELAKRIDAI
jgi:4a-hydroxytetrahydrobiopterin dehydratase